MLKKRSQIDISRLSWDPPPGVPLGSSWMTQRTPAGDHTTYGDVDTMQNAMEEMERIRLSRPLVRAGDPDPYADDPSGQLEYHGLRPSSISHDHTSSEDYVDLYMKDPDMQPSSPWVPAAYLALRLGIAGLSLYYILRAAREAAAQRKKDEEAAAKRKKDEEVAAKPAEQPGVAVVP